MTKLTYKSVNRDRLFFEQYRYCVQLYYTCASVFRDLPDNFPSALLQVTQGIKSRRDWDHRAGRDFFGSSEEDNRAKDLLEHLFKTTDRKLVIGYRTIYVYSNDQAFLESIGVYFPVRNRKEALVNRTRGTVISVDNPYQYRSYLRQRRLEPEQKQWLSNWVQNQSSIRANLSLRKFCSLDKHRTTYGHFYIEHGDMATLSMLALIIPDLVRETKQIINR